MSKRSHSPEVGLGPDPAEQAITVSSRGSSEDSNSSTMTNEAMPSSMKRLATPDEMPAGAGSTATAQAAVPSRETSSSSTSHVSNSFTSSGQHHVVLTSEPVSFNKVGSIDELDKRVLQLQNQKLWEALNMNREVIAELRAQIANAEKRQANDDEILFVVNRYWNQMDEDCLILLDRFETDVADTMSSESESFLKELASWNSEEVSEKLRERVHFSKRIVARLHAAYDRLLMRQDRLRLAMLGECETYRSKLSSADAGSERLLLKTGSSDQIIDTLRQEINQFMTENHRLQGQLTSMHQKYRGHSLQVRELQDKNQVLSDQVGELQAKLEDAEYKCQQSQHSLKKMDAHLTSTIEMNKSLQEQLATYNGSPSSGHDHKEKVMLDGLSNKKFKEMAVELDELRELATNRLNELEQLQRRFEEKASEAARLAMQLRETPKSVIVDSPPYKSLLAQFNILYNEVIYLRDQLEDSRSMIMTIRKTHMEQLDSVEKNESAILDRMRQEIMEQVEHNTRLKQECEHLKIDYEQTTTQNEQAGSITNEMRSLIATLQTQNKQQKAEVNRYRKKCKELCEELDRYKLDSRQTELELDKTQSALKEAVVYLLRYRDPSATTLVEKSTKIRSLISEAKNRIEKLGEYRPAPPFKQEGDDIIPSGSAPAKNEVHLTSEMLDFIGKQLSSLQTLFILVNDLIKLGLAKRLPTINPDEGPREWASFLVELTQLRHACGRLFSLLPPASNTDDSTKILELTGLETEAYSQSVFARDWAVNRICLDLAIMQRKWHQATEHLQGSQQHVVSAQQQEQILLKEMEVTVQAFEDVQEQNTRLEKTLREKEDAHLKQMSDWMKSAQTVRMLRDEKKMIDDRIRIANAKIDTLNQVVQKQEDKEKLLLTNINKMEREASLRQQAQEAFKRKAVESQQVAEDLRVTVQKYLSQLKDVQDAVQEKATAYERVIFRQQRLQEELVNVRRKYDRLRKIEQSHNADEVLQAEIQEYKDKLTCSACKTNKKDAILTKCFHVFCLQCLKTRYETRNRKCPKCNALFGANDYHRIYLT